MWLPVICPLTTLNEHPAYGGSLHSGHVKYREFLLRALGHHMILSPEAYYIHRFEYFQDLPFSALALTWGNQSINLSPFIYLSSLCVCVHAHTHTHTHWVLPDCGHQNNLHLDCPCPFKVPASWPGLSHWRQDSPEWHSRPIKPAQISRHPIDLKLRHSRDPPREARDTRLELSPISIKYLLERGPVQGDT